MARRGKKPAAVADVNAFMHDVEEMMRLERMADFWQRYKLLLIASVVAVIVVISGVRYMLRAAEQGKLTEADQYYALLTEPAASVADFTAFAGSSNMGHRLLAQFEAAKRALAAGDLSVATVALQSIIDDTALPQVYQDLARIHLGAALMDSAPERAEQALGILLARGSVFRDSATELVAHLKVQQGKVDEAKSLYNIVLNSDTAPQSLKQRAAARLSMLTQ